MEQHLEQGSGARTSESHRSFACRQRAQAFGFIPTLRWTEEDKRTSDGGIGVMQTEGRA